MNKQLEFPFDNDTSKTDGSALVVLSGGQDSTTCLVMALAKYKTVYAISFYYNQRHSSELDAARSICELYGVQWTCVDVPMLADFDDSALIRGNEAPVTTQHHRNDKLPSTFVPNRNALFLTTAHAYAQKLGVKHVITGVCETDYSGYPDCRDVFIRSLEETLNLGYETDIKFITPLMYLNKAETFEIADKLGELNIVVNQTVTCYEGLSYTHRWGKGCGKCPACVLRANGYDEFIKGKK